MKRDDPDALQVRPWADLPAPAHVIVQVLEPLVTPARLARINAVVAQRSRCVIPVLDRITDPHNISAILRSADAFGVAEVHVIAPDSQFRVAKRVAKGADRWIETVQHVEPGPCIAALHDRGYDVLVASLSGGVAPKELSQRKRVAVVFGNEHDGPDQALVRAADGTFAVPMVGFVESLNVSVAAAITLFAACTGRPGDLPEAERADLTARFLMKSVRDSARIVRERGAS